MTRDEDRQGLYADPVLYDILYRPGTAAEVDALQRIERRHAPAPPPRGALWFEPACGGGRYLGLAARRGRRVAGFDRDPGQLAYARRRLTRATPCDPCLFQADLADFAQAAGRAGLAPESVDFAFIPVNSLRHLDKDTDVLNHLRQVAGLLRPGGLYVVGISLTDYGRLVPDEDLWEGVRGTCRVSQVVNYLPPEPDRRRARIETVISHLTVTRPRGTEHRDDRYDLRTYDRRQWRALIARSPLTLAASCDARGGPLAASAPAYQLEVLRKAAPASAR